MVRSMLFYQFLLFFRFAEPLHRAFPAAVEHPGVEGTLRASGTNSKRDYNCFDP